MFVCFQTGAGEKFRYFGSVFRVYGPNFVPHDLRTEDICWWAEIIHGILVRSMSWKSVGKCSVGASNTTSSIVMASMVVLFVDVPVYRHGSASDGEETCARRFL